MRRREFIAGVGSAAAWPMAVLAQGAIPVVGFLNSGSPGPATAQVDAFRRGLKEHGYVVGQNVMLDFRWAEGRFDQLPGMASDLVNRKVTVIFAGGPPAAIAAKSATSTIPIVFTSGDDPIQSGLVGYVILVATLPASASCSARRNRSGWSFCVRCCLQQVW
jgi:putative tryptophan/tyrosine transport system substrate-binding protein